MYRRRVHRIYGSLMDRQTVKGLENTLAGDPEAWIETNVLIAVIRDNAREPVPEAVIDYLKQRLEGKVRKRQGRARAARTPSKELRSLIISSLFERYETWLTARKARLGLTGWAAISATDWWQGPPSERAARMVLRRSGLNISWRRIQDIAYERRRKAPQTRP